MKLVFTQPEIEQILRAHVNANVTLANGANYSIDFVATRSDDGIVATIEIPYMSVSSFPAIAGAASANVASPGPSPVTPAGIATTAKTAAKQTPKKSASSILGGGLTPATEPAQNPEPVTAATETAETAPSDAPDATEAPFAEAVDVAEAEGSQPAEAVNEAPPAAVRGPSLFGNSAFKL